MHVKIFLGSLAVFCLMAVSSTSFLSPALAGTGSTVWGEGKAFSATLDPVAAAYVIRLDDVGEFGDISAKAATPRTIADIQKSPKVGASAISKGVAPAMTVGHFDPGKHSRSQFHRRT